MGKDFDALIVDLAQGDGNLEIWPNESTEDRLSKWIHLGDDRSVARVYVHGVEVKEAAKKVLSVRRLVRKRKQSDSDSRTLNGEQAQ
jgi:cytosine/adenosine deaminase-related metal-dependent hydrolase